MACCFIHCSQVERFTVEQRCSRKKRIDDRALADRIDVGAGAGAESGAEPVRRLAARMDGDGRAAHHVQRIAGGFQIETVRGVGDGDHLTQGVNTCVGTPCGNGYCWVIEELLEGGFQITLNRSNITLTRESVKGGPVVGKVEAEIQLSSFSSVPPG
jgi:hypothetical protein